MIGNDVIDLQLAFKNENWKRQRFQDKLFSKNEKSAISAATEPQFLTWLFWSMKEAAYKAHQRQFNIKRRYNPWYFECILEEINQNTASGKVTAGKQSYYTKSFFNFEKIHTLASASKNQAVHEECLVQGSSEAIKKAMLLQIQQKLRIADPAITYNEHFIPQLSSKKGIHNLPFSISHHGQFSAFAFALNNF